MEVKDKVMYHYHKKGIYDELWGKGKEITVDNNFRSYYSTILDFFTTGVQCQDDKVSSFDRVISYYLQDDIFKTIEKDLTKQLLLEAKKIITQTNVCRREFALEKMRQNNYPDLPSRLHSIWLTDKENLDFWSKYLITDSKLKDEMLQLYELNVTGNLFKSSDYYIPDDKLTMHEMMLQSIKYWNPEFDKDEALNGIEYLFQGKVKIIKRIENI